MQVKGFRNHGLLWLVGAAVIAILLAVGGAFWYRSITTTNYELVDVSQPLQASKKVVTAHGVASLTHKQSTVSSLSFGKDTVVVTMAHYQFGSGNKQVMTPKHVDLAIYQYDRTQFEQTYAKLLASKKANNVVALNGTIKAVKPTAGVYLPTLSKTDQQSLNMNTTGKQATYAKLTRDYAAAGRKVGYRTHFTASTRMYQDAKHLNASHVKQFKNLVNAVRFLKPTMGS
ncbi:hypothetical protein [Furfurilactobacillus siliginis]|uniref:Uncharacterized protein n=1 Tax=Furfurilactobacillus siliginis TaxID=348151 RepID=A0A0R2L8J8_9LACO|nr:hypothetical protein [Furfurilactobacillus siliginis]KRN96149.1 hypothetical protein IV55_GL001533 [Furfurilactobacillus siliginis]GEK27927.1 hypothetical protein LSI01_02380 [Furfurilactobacillus siliginis]